MSDGLRSMMSVDYRADRHRDLSPIHNGIAIQRRLVQAMALTKGRDAAKR